MANSTLWWTKVGFGKSGVVQARKLAELKTIWKYYEKWIWRFQAFGALYTNREGTKAPMQTWFFARTRTVKLGAGPQRKPITQSNSKTGAELPLML
eukprot:4479576-Amphidinium_carterae.1